MSPRHCEFIFVLECCFCYHLIPQTTVTTFKLSKPVRRRKKNLLSETIHFKVIDICFTIHRFPVKSLLLTRLIWCRNLHRLCLSIDRIWIDLCDNDRFHSDCSPLSSQQSEVCDYSLCLPASVKWRSPLGVDSDLVRRCEGHIYKDSARSNCDNVKVCCETEAGIWRCLWSWSVKMKLEADYAA